MPSIKLHEKQYNHNFSLLKEELFDINNTSYSDWVATIYFYSLVHLIEKELAKLNSHPSNHRERNLEMVKHNGVFNTNLQTKYQSLYNISIISRYKCNKIRNKLLAFKAKTLLEEIEKELE